MKSNGYNATCCCINAIGNSLPPMYIFPRVHFKSYMLKGASSESLGLAYPPDWMTGDLFAKAINHFIKCMKVSKSNPGVLLMDNHISHLSIDTIDMAKKMAYVCLLSPHIAATSCNHLT